jgi:hypothetical protein
MPTLRSNFDRSEADPGASRLRASSALSDNGLHQLRDRHEVAIRDN